MWFGTKDGLNRFDGYRFKTYRGNSNPIHSLGSNYIQSLHEYKGIIWVGTDKGLYQYDKKSDRFSILNEAINDRIAAIEPPGGPFAYQKTIRGLNSQPSEYRD